MTNNFHFFHPFLFISEKNYTVLDNNFFFYLDNNDQNQFHRNNLATKNTIYREYHGNFTIFTTLGGFGGLESTLGKPRMRSSQCCRREPHAQIAPGKEIV